MKRLVFLLIAVIFGCAPQAQHGPQATDGFSDFGPTVKDTRITFKESATFNDLLPVGTIAESSADIFRFSDEVFNYSHGNRNDINLKIFGHYLLNLFYSDPRTSTHFGPTNSMYLPAAMAFEGENIYRYMKSLGSDETSNKVLSVISEQKISWPSTASLRPRELITSIKDYLFILAAKLADAGVNASIVESFTKSIEANFLSGLNQAEITLSKVEPDASLQSNILAIKETVSNLKILPDTLRNNIQNQLTDAETLQLLVDRKYSLISKAEDMVEVMARIWLKLSPPDRVKYIQSVSRKLYEVFSKSSKEKLQYWGGILHECEGRENPPSCYEGGPFDGLYRTGLEKEFKASCFPQIKQALHEWLNRYSEVERGLEFKNRYPDIYQLFTQPLFGNRLSDDDLGVVVDNLYSFEITTLALSDEFRIRAQNVCVERIVTTVSKSLNDYVLRTLDKTIRGQEKNLQDLVASSVSQNLQNLRKTVGEISNFEDYFNKFAIPELDRVMFSDVKELPGVERKDVQLGIDENQKLSLRVNSQSSSFLTGAEVLGTSMSASAKRFAGLASIESKDPRKPEYWRPVFSQINKMLAMLGLRKMDNSLMSSFHRRISGVYENFDAYRYDCSPEVLAKQEQKKLNYTQTPIPDHLVTRFEDCTDSTQFSQSYFAIPDTLAVKDAFAVVDAGVPYISVSGQAELLKGTSGMMKYFRDWKGQADDYDIGLGQIEYKGFKLLPRPAFVNLSFGIMSVPLRNLRRENNLIHMFDQWGTEIKDWLKNSDPMKWRVSTALSDLTPNGNSPIIRSRDLARFIIAIDELLKSSEGVENSKASVFTPPGKSERENLKAFEEGRKQLALMMVGLSNFLTSKFQDKDGGFWHTYSLESKQLIEKNQPRTLEDQSLIQDALIRTFAHWGGHGAKWAAIDSFYFLNSKMWDGNLGFYRANENGEGTHNPYALILTLRNIRNLTPLMKDESSRTQANLILDFWDSKLLNWIRFQTADASANVQ